MKYLSLFRSKEYLEAAYEEMKNDNLRYINLSFFDALNTKEDWSLFKETGRVRRGVNYNTYLPSFWEFFYNRLCKATGYGDAYRHIPKDLLQANCYLAALYTFLEIKNDDDYVPYMDILTKISPDWKRKQKNDLRSIQEAFLKASRNEYPSNDHSKISSDHEAANKFYFANEYVSLRAKPEDELTIEIGGYDKFLPIQIILNHHLNPSRIGSKYKKNDVVRKKKKQNEEEPLEKSLKELIDMIYSNAPMEDRLTAFFKTNNKNQAKERWRNSKKQLKQAFQALIEIDNWENTLNQKPHQRLIYLYEKELIFHVNSISFILNIFREEDVNPGCYVLFEVLASACLNPMVIGVDEVVYHVLYDSRSIDDIREETMSLSQIMKDFCVELYGLFNSNIALCIELLSKYVDRHLDQFFSFDHEKLRGSFEYKLTDTIIDSAIDQIFTALPAKTYNERISLFYKLMWAFTTSTMTTYEHNTPKGIETQFLLFKIEIWTRNVLLEGDWEPLDIKKWISSPTFYLTEPEEWQCNPQPLIDICMEQDYKEATIYELLNWVQNTKIGFRQNEVSWLTDMVKDCDSEGKVVAALEIMALCKERQYESWTIKSMANILLNVEIENLQDEAAWIKKTVEDSNTEERLNMVLAIRAHCKHRCYDDQAIKRIISIVLDLKIEKEQDGVLFDLIQKCKSGEKLITILEETWNVALGILDICKSRNYDGYTLGRITNRVLKVIVEKGQDEADRVMKIVKECSSGAKLIESLDAAFPPNYIITYMEIDGERVMLEGELPSNT